MESLAQLSDVDSEKVSLKSSMIVLTNPQLFHEAVDGLCGRTAPRFTSYAKVWAVSLEYFSYSCSNF
jgi:hypothetical protein